MPGMMDTVLNIGLNDEIAEGMVAADRRRALRLRRLPPPGRRCSARVVHGHARRAVRGSARTRTQARRGVASGRRADRRGPGRPSPRVQGDRPASDQASTSRRTRIEQLRLATEAVFESWNGKRAVDYRNAARHRRTTWAPRSTS
ncbi:MAG: hypothetical protein MZU91_13540 [Desulfosudis oleivorans]|nr:hypothetical protein [Desulfosudis oleivorans]